MSMLYGLLGTWIIGQWNYNLGAAHTTRESTTAQPFVCDLQWFFGEVLGGVLSVVIFALFTQYGRWNPS